MAAPREDRPSAGLLDLVAFVPADEPGLSPWMEETEEEVSRAMEKGCPRVGEKGKQEIEGENGFE